MRVEAGLQRLAPVVRLPVAGQRDQPDVALVDVGLPEFDGYEVARQVRKTAGTTIRLIALTGYGQPDDRRQALEAGFDAHLVKPVEAEILQAAIVM